MYALIYQCHSHANELRLKYKIKINTHKNISTQIVLKVKIGKYIIY